MGPQDYAGMMGQGFGMLGQGIGQQADRNAVEAEKNRPMSAWALNEMKGPPDAAAEWGKAVARNEIDPEMAAIAAKSNVPYSPEAVRQLMEQAGMTQPQVAMPQPGQVPASSGLSQGGMMSAAPMRAKGREGPSAPGSRIGMMGGGAPDLRSKNSWEDYRPTAQDMGDLERMQALRNNTAKANKPAAGQSVEDRLLIIETKAKLDEKAKDKDREFRAGEGDKEREQRARIADAKLKADYARMRNQMSIAIKRGADALSRAEKSGSNSLTFEQKREIAQSVATINAISRTVQEGSYNVAGGEIQASYEKLVRDAEMFRQRAQKAVPDMEVPGQPKTPNQTPAAPSGSSLNDAFFK